MKFLNSKFLLILITQSVITFSCSSDDSPEAPVNPNPEPENVTLNSEINDFVWSGLNEIYLWQDNVPDLADTKDDDQNSYFTFLNGFSSPESLFDALLYRKDDIDRFSFLVNDFEVLENSFAGNSFSSGIDFRLSRIGDSDDVFGYIRYIANGSDAASKDVSRGEFFTRVNGEHLTVNNFSDLLFGDNNNIRLGMATVSNGTISDTSKEVELTKTDFTENPILINKVIEKEGHKIGYLMYNSFVFDFDDELNIAIGELKNQGVTDLVLDLRYNGGGRVSSAIILSSMITGQFDNQVFSTEIWNNRYQAIFQEQAPERLVNRFTNTLLDDTPINKLNLNKLYVLTTTGTASASELVINSLRPYIDVVQIGTNTTGKYTASITLYDSNNFAKDNASLNPNHKYALQPLVLKSANKDGVGDYADGLAPDHLITYQVSNGNTFEGEDITNLGILGDENEPYLAKALELITGSTSKKQQRFAPIDFNFEYVSDSKDGKLMGKEMYITIDDLGL